MQLATLNDVFSHATSRGAGTVILEHGADGSWKPLSSNAL